VSGARRVDLRPHLPARRAVGIDGLAERLGISITPVREALVRAASLLLLTRESNRGFRVALLLTTEEYHQLFGVRRLIELYAVGARDPRRADRRARRRLPPAETPGASSAIRPDARERVELDALAAAKEATHGR